LKVRQVDSYYPFGMNIKGLTGNSNDPVRPNEYLYNGKLMQDEMGLNWLDYGARFYDAVLGRWHSVDPLAGNYFKWSPYNYCLDNPNKYTDPDGMRVDNEPNYISSTHTDPTGKVIAVYDDKDLGVYRHYDCYTQDDVDKKHSATNTSAGGEYMGRTVTWDSFTKYDKRNGKIDPAGNIDFDSYEAYYFLDALENYLDQIMEVNGSFMGSVQYAIFATNNSYWDFKSRANDRYRGSRINKSGTAIYMSARDVGNFGAGFAARKTGMKKFDYMIRAGALQLGGKYLMLFYQMAAFKQGYPAFGEHPRSNKAQRMGYENIRTPEAYKNNYVKIWSDN
jgi:RHS repeat-associated protein